MHTKRKLTLLSPYSGWYFEHRNTFVLPSTIDSLQKNTAIGDLYIPIKCIKMCKLELSSQILLIINKSFSTSIFPDVLKLAKVKPLYNKHDHTSMGNYRPVSILSCVSKIFEKVMKNRLSNFLIKMKPYVNINLDSERIILQNWLCYK